MDKNSRMSPVADRLISLILRMSEEQQEILLEKLESKIINEKRRHKRKTFKSVVDYALKGRVYRDFIRDISSGGVYIETSRDFSIGQQVTLIFPIPHYQEHVKVNGRIVRITDSGIGVQFEPKSLENSVPPEWIRDKL